MPDTTLVIPGRNTEAAACTGLPPVPGMTSLFFTPASAVPGKPKQNLFSIRL